MTNLKLSEEVKAVPLSPKVEVQPEPPKAEVPKVIEGFKQRSPNEWNIKATANGIIASSNLGDKFEGSIADFNKLLRA